MPDLQSCNVLDVDTLEEGIGGSEFGGTEVCLVSAEPDAVNGMDSHSGKDRPTMKRRFLSDDDAPRKLRREVDEICRRLVLSRRRDRRLVLRQLRLQTEFRGCYVAYIPTRSGISVIACARPGLDDIYQRIEDAGGLKRSERSKVVIGIPIPGDNEQATVWSPFVADEI